MLHVMSMTGFAGVLISMWAGCTALLQKDDENDGGWEAAIHGIINCIRESFIITSVSACDGTRPTLAHVS